MQDEIIQIENELEQARQDLHQTLSQVNRKVERVGIQLRPKYLVNRYPIPALCTAAMLGFVVGYSGRRSALLGAVIAGGVIGVLARNQNQMN